MKRIFKWLLRLFLLAIVLVVIFFLSFDTLVKIFIEHRIHSQTGLKISIGKFYLGFTKPIIEIKNLKIYNPTNFGGQPFLVIPEIYVEYDQAALAQYQLHVTQMRFNLGELDIVKNQAGQTNIFSLGLKLSTKKSDSENELNDFKKKSGLAFKGIDQLNVAFGTAKYIDLKNPQNNFEQNIGLTNVPAFNVKSPADLAGIILIVSLNSANFFDSIFGSQNSFP
jgi:uncharacterized protein involved in outer membrane biogenesis